MSFVTGGLFDSGVTNTSARRIVDTQKPPGHVFVKPALTFNYGVVGPFLVTGRILEFECYFCMFDPKLLFKNATQIKLLQHAVYLCLPTYKSARLLGCV